jgi:hypothetical protein
MRKQTKDAFSVEEDTSDRYGLLHDGDIESRANGNGNGNGWANTPSPYSAVHDDAVYPAHSTERDDYFSKAPIGVAGPSQVPFPQAPYDRA